ncbi:MAG: sugar ABC transporter ATP-binding protein [Actinobacteria bacterium]|nr:sugar ABC transporter ATP-binding protein [Actinomycetota bacterium]
MPTSKESVAVRIVNITKHYGSTTVLSDVSLDLHSATIHGFVGENGAGKSTCVSIVAGRTSASEGHIEAFGAPLQLGSPRAALKAGIAAVYQELMIISRRTALENVFLPVESGRRGPLLLRREMRARYEALLERLGVDIPQDAKAETLSTGNRQVLEIARALSHKARFVLFDEPTAALSVAEKTSLFRLMKVLRLEGVGMVLVTHDLAEMKEAAELISVFRDGMLVETRPTQEWSRPELVSAMAGPRVRVTGLLSSSQVSDPSTAPLARMGLPLLRLSDVRLSSKKVSVDLEVREGEIVGLAGLMGSGRSSLLRSLAGHRACASGAMEIQGRHRRWPATPIAGHQLGFHYLPEDRKVSGLVPHASAANNILLGSLGVDSTGFILRSAKARARSQAVAQRVRLRTSDLALPAERLSGGTQQKLLLARALVTGFEVLLADEPTRGVDVNARADIWAAIKEIAAEGKGALVAVSDLDELLEVADRLIVLPAAGKAIELCGAAQGTTREVLVEAMFQ